MRVEHSEFGAPSDLSVTPTSIRRFMLIGECILDNWRETFKQISPLADCDQLHFKNLPKDAPKPVAEYDFQIIALPLRSVVGDRPFVVADFRDEASIEKVFKECCERIEKMLEYSMRYNVGTGLLSFVTNFFVPIANPAGRFAPRYGLSNPQHFVYCLNQKIADAMQHYRNCSLLDIDNIAASVGRRYVQDDFVAASSHGAVLSDDIDGRHWDDARISPPPYILDVYERHKEKFLASVWADVGAQFRTKGKVDAVKMVVFDLDDTLWQGVIGDTNASTDLRTEGWPLGLVEAANHLKRRGVLLAIASRNDESFVKCNWPHGHLQLSDFAFCSISWKPKVEGIQEMIRVANILPSSVVFVDDNPVERAAVEAALPGVRTLGHNPYVLKRILLWSSETQTDVVTSESTARTAMIQAQAEREKVRATTSHKEFLDSLSTTIVEINISDVNHPSFARMLELTNKTNQFNTTGQRWTSQEVMAWIESGNSIACYSAKDRFSDYGLIGVVFHTTSEITQFLMSCRVMGMAIEEAIISSIIGRARHCGIAQISAVLVETPRNLPCRHIYREYGFCEGPDGRLVYDCDVKGLPPHITLQTSIG